MSQRRAPSSLSDPLVPRKRRALTHVGGPVKVLTGERELGKVMNAALRVESRDDQGLSHIHGFHSYPARMHPDTAHTLVEALSAKAQAVLDPFCGSGTVLVATRELGRRGFGSDLNPLAVELSRLKTHSITPAFAETLVEMADRAIAHAQERKLRKLGPTHPYPQVDRALFAPHVLLELDGLRSGIQKLENGDAAWVLALVVSALLTKVSTKGGDSSTRTEEKRLASGFVFRFFRQKTQDLARRLLKFSAMVPSGTPNPRVEVADARSLGFMADASVALIVSSPPYPGVYDYYDHHELRLRWLGLDGRTLQKGELGSRRSAKFAGAEARLKWQAGFSSCLAEMRRVLVPGGKAALLVADSVVERTAFYADDWLPPLAVARGLVTLGHAAQSRPHFHLPSARAFSGRPRREHLFVLAAD